ncbi:MAG TPA: DUF4365 domain-containing protein, partial [Thermoanaerobaculia bacterium]|nr:DUF4365 domain-containing protein [Thermoanaerobaculia bacterium]
VKRKNDRTGSGGTAIVDAIVNLDMGWIYRPQDKPGTDYGVDAHLEVTDDEGVETGRQLAAQVKAGQSYFREHTNDGFINRPSDRHVRYWRDYALPVILILVDEQTRVAYWAFTDRVESTDGGGWKLVIPRTQTLGPQAKSVLSEAAVGGGTERTRARIEERQQAEHLRRRVEDLEGLIATYMAQLAARPAASIAPAPAPPIDVLTLTFSELIAWTDAADFETQGTAPGNRTAYGLAAEQLFFQESIEEHDAAKAVTLLLLAHEWGKAGSIFLYGINLTRRMPQVDTPSILDFLAESLLPTGMPLDLRIILRTMHIAARRRHGRGVDALLAELDALVAQATPVEGYAVTAAAFWEARATSRSAPARAIRYLRSAATLRPEAKGFGGGPFPSTLDETWPLMLELTASGVASHNDLAVWLDALDAVPAEARASFVGDEMNVVTIANRFWLDESARPEAERSWASIHNTLELLETWGAQRSAPLLFAAARRGRIVIRGEYEHDLATAIRLATDVPSFVREHPHAMFLVNEIAASQFLYAGAHLEAVIAFRGALVTRPPGSSVLATALLKAAQAAAAADALADAVRWAREGVDATRAAPYRASTDLAVAQAELSLAVWYAGDREAALDLWDETAEYILAIEENTARWRGLVVRFHWASGYLANTYRTGVAPTSDVEGRPYGEPRPGAFLIDLTAQADMFTDKVRFGVLLGLAAVSDRRQRDARTRWWIYAALDLATERIPEWRRMIALLALPHLITDGRYLEAVELGRAMVTAWESEGLSSGADGRIVAMSFSIVPAFLGVARQPLEVRRAAAQELLDALLNAGETDATGIACREVVKIALLSEVDQAERHMALLSIRNSTTAKIQESPLGMLCDLAVSVLPGTAPADALALHARAVAELKPRLSIFPTMYRLHVVPFFRDYWVACVAEHPQAFNAPGGMAAALGAITNDDDAPRAMLLVVANHLRLP